LYCAPTCSTTKPTSSAAAFASVRVFPERSGTLTNAAVAVALGVGFVVGVAGPAVAVATAATVAVGDGRAEASGVPIAGRAVAGSVARTPASGVAVACAGSGVAVGCSGASVGNPATTAVNGTVSAAFPKGVAMTEWLGKQNALVSGGLPIFDARHNVPRIGRIVMARGRDAGDVPITMAFGQNQLARFNVTTCEVDAFGNAV